MFNTIRSQTLSIIAEVTANPKPTYSIDGQAVSWTEYLAQLQKTISWCDDMLAREDGPVEVVSTAR